MNPYEHEQLLASAQDCLVRDLDFSGQSLWLARRRAIAPADPDLPGGGRGEATTMTDLVWRAAAALGEIRDGTILLSLLDALERAGLTPTSYTAVDGGRSIRYSRADFEADLPRLLDGTCLELVGSSPKFEASIDVGSRPIFRVWVDGAIAPAERASWLTFASDLVGLLSPEYAIAGWGPSPARSEQGYATWSTASERDLAVLRVLHRPMPKDYYRLGPPGLGLRTYFSSYLVELMGENRLFDLPAKVDRHEDGVLVDLCEDLLSSEFADVLSVWRESLDLLAPSGVFPPLDIDEEDKFIEFIERAPRYQRPPK